MSIDPDRSRLLRRRHMHERQAVIFGVLLAGLALSGLGGVAVYTGALDVPGLERGFSTPTPEPGSVVIVPCPPAGSAPVPYAQISIAVLNGSKRSGLAAQTANALVERQFVVATTDNATAGLSASARITFGVAGVAAGYTVAAQFDDPIMVLDNRQDASVEVVVGEAYSGLLAADLIALDPTVPFASPKGCVPIDQIPLTPLPAPTTDETEAAAEPAEGETPAG